MSDKRYPVPPPPPQNEMKLNCGSGSGGGCGCCLMLALAIVIIVSILLALPSLAGEPDQRLLDAMRRVESGGNDRAVGDSGRSHGPYQIQRGYWNEACRYGGARWPYDRCVWDRQRSEQVIRWYWQKYGATTDQERARIHNGGPAGGHEPATAVYWTKVRRAMTCQR